MTANLTGYRLLPLHDEFCNSTEMYLQFKSVETKKIRRLFGGPLFKTEEVWRFVPREDASYVTGNYLNEYCCPVNLNRNSIGSFEGKFYFLKSLVGLENELRNFVDKYPDIQQYFDYLEARRKRYLEDKNKEKNAQIVYLNKNPSFVS